MRQIRQPVTINLEIKIRDAMDFIAEMQFTTRTEYIRRAILAKLDRDCPEWRRLGQLGSAEAAAAKHHIREAGRDDQ